MRPLSFLLPLLAATGLVSARSVQHVGKKLPANLPQPRLIQRSPAASNKTGSFLTPKTKKFVVNGAAIPDVDFDIGESYSGLLPISSKADEDAKLYFWFFPSTSTEPAEDIPLIIWLNGGPGCSSLEGLLQENGPFLWQYGTFKPVKNPWTWINLAHMIWVEQPVGTGFSQGTPTATSEEDVAAQFGGFFKNFVDTFDLHGKEVYITGESYAGNYVPYISDYFLQQKDEQYYNFQGLLIYDPSLSSDTIQEQIPAVAFVDYWSHLLALNESFTDDIHSRADSCGYTDYLNENLVYPPKGKFPATPEVTSNCDLWTDIWNAVSAVNPCADLYQVATTCPLLWDVLGFPGSFDYLPAGAEIYFNRTEVQKAINAPVGNWAECTSTNVFPSGDNSLPSTFQAIPNVLDAGKPVMIGHGLLDYILLANGTLLAIQNMTWNGAQGFTAEPSDPFVVPYHTDTSPSTLAGAGVFGRTRTERNLTYVDITLSGHMVPQYAPSAAYRMVEYLLGKIDSLGE